MTPGSRIHRAWAIVRAGTILWDTVRPTRTAAWGAYERLHRRLPGPLPDFIRARRLRVVGEDE